MLSFRRDSYLRRITTRVTNAGEESGRPYVVLEDTVFYPEGGGQPADRGRIAGIRVGEAREGPDGIRHFLEEPVALEAGREVVAEIDWERRFDHMQQHTAQHLLTAIAQDRFGWPTTAFHLGPSLSDVELDVPELGSEDLRELEDAAAAEIRAARAVRAREVAPDEMQRLPVRTRGLPDPLPPRIRLVEIDGLDLNTCGGTHLGTTAEIESIAMVGTEPMRGGTRVFFVAGRRLTRRLRSHEERNAALREVLGAGDGELTAVAAAKLEQLKRSLRTARRLGEALSASTGEALAARAAGQAGAELVQVTRLPADDAKLVQATARRFSALATAGVVLVLGGDGPEGPFAVAAPPSAGYDLASLGAAAAEALEGRGGGKDVFQGKARRLDREAAARRALRAEIGG